MRRSPERLISVAGSAEGSKLETVVSSPHAVEPLCPHFGTCGGCVYQNLSYEAQLEGKQQRVWPRQTQ